MIAEAPVGPVGLPPNRLPAGNDTSLAAVKARNQEIKTSQLKLGFRGSV